MIATHSPVTCQWFQGKHLERVGVGRGLDGHYFHPEEALHLVEEGHAEVVCNGETLSLPQLYVLCGGSPPIVPNSTPNHDFRPARNLPSPIWCLREDEDVWVRRAAAERVSTHYCPLLCHPPLNGLCIQDSPDEIPYPKGCNDEGQLIQISN